MFFVWSPTPVDRDPWLWCPLREERCNDIKDIKRLYPYTIKFRKKIHSLKLLVFLISEIGSGVDNLSDPTVSSITYDITQRVLRRSLLTDKGVEDLHDGLLSGVYSFADSILLGGRSCFNEWERSHRVWVTTSQCFLRSSLPWFPKRSRSRGSPPTVDPGINLDVVSNWRRRRVKTEEGGRRDPYWGVLWRIICRMYYER